jgi:hypothetical protein
MCDQQPRANPDDIRAEYDALISYHNSIITHRFTLLGFFLATVGIIIQGGVTPQDALLIIALTVTLYMVERRNRVLYIQMGKRAMQIEENYWKLVKYNNDRKEIIELPLFCSFEHDRRLKSELKDILSEKIKEDLNVNPEIFDKYKIKWLPASHSVGLDFLYCAVAVYAVGYLFYYLFILIMKIAEQCA